MNHEAGVFCGLIVTVRASYLLVEKSILILFLSFFIVSFLPKRQSSQNMISQPRPSKRQYRDTFSLIKIHLNQQSTINQNSKICINQSINQFIVQSIYLSQLPYNHLKIQNLEHHELILELGKSPSTRATSPLTQKKRRHIRNQFIVMSN